MSYDYVLRASQYTVCLVLNFPIGFVIGVCKRNHPLTLLQDWSKINNYLLIELKKSSKNYNDFQFTDLYSLNNFYSLINHRENFHPPIPCFSKTSSPYDQLEKLSKTYIYFMKNHQRHTESVGFLLEFKSGVWTSCFCYGIVAVYVDNAFPIHICTCTSIFGKQSEWIKKSQIWWMQFRKWNFRVICRQLCHRMFRRRIGCGGNILISLEVCIFEAI